MTCIVGYIDKKNKKMYMGGDSAGVSGLNVVVRRDTKVFQNGPMLIGYTSSFRMGQLLRFKLKVPRNKRKDDYEYMCTDFIDAVRELFSENKYTTVRESVESGGTFLVAYKGNLYDVEDDFQVGWNVEPYNSVGCGVYYARGALGALEGSDLSPEEQIKKTLEIVEYNSGGVQAPFNVISKTY